MHLGMVAVMNAAISLEDPFATDGVDGVYCSETLFEVEQVTDPSHFPSISHCFSSCQCQFLKVTKCLYVL